MGATSHWLRRNSQHRTDRLEHVPVVPVRRHVESLLAVDDRARLQSTRRPTRLTGGHLGFYTTKPLKPAGVARLAFDILRGRLRENADVTETTGTAVDLYVGELLGMGVDSTNPASRLHMSQGATYRWLVRNAERFGFVPYLYEPWHWEYVGPEASYAP